MSKKIIIALLSLAVVYMLLCGFGVTNTFWGWDSRHSPFIWKLVMLACTAGVGYLIYAYATGRVEKLSWPLVAGLLAFGFASSTGFKFTAGDVKQVKTYLNMEGKVIDTTFLFTCYEGFYHFNEDPDLKQYVRDYGELPGRNLWNSFILRGKIPASNAPRANEDFEWHTGAYDMDLKDCK